MVKKSNFNTDLLKINQRVASGMVKKWLLVLLAGIFLVGCGRANVSEPTATVQAKSVTQEQIYEAMKILATDAYEYGLGEYPNSDGQTTNFCIRYIMGRQSEKIKNKKIAIADVQDVAKKFLGKEIQNPKSTDTYQYADDMYTMVPYGREEETKFVVDVIKPISQNTYLLEGSVYDVPSRFNRNSSAKVFEIKVTFVLTPAQSTPVVILDYKMNKVAKVSTNNDAEEAKQLLFEYMPKWQEMLKQGKHSIQLKSGEEAYSRFVVEDKGRQGESFVFHVYNMIEYPNGSGHTATIGWYKVNLTAREIYDTVLNKKVY